MEWPVKAVNATMRIVEQATDYIAANGLLGAITHPFCQRPAREQHRGWIM